MGEGNSSCQNTGDNATGESRASRLGYAMHRSPETSCLGWDWQWPGHAPGTLCLVAEECGHCGKTHILTLLCDLGRFPVCSEIEKPHFLGQV